MGTYRNSSKRYIFFDRDGTINVDDTTNATTTTDGSLQTDGGLSVALDTVIGNDLILYLMLQLFILVLTKR